MAYHLMEFLMVGEAYVTELAGRYPAALSAFQYRSVASTVLEKDDLLIVVEGIPHLFLQHGGKRRFHELAVHKVFDIHDADFRQTYVPVSLLE